MSVWLGQQSRFFAELCAGYSLLLKFVHEEGTCTFAWVLRGSLSLRFLFSLRAARDV